MRRAISLSLALVLVAVSACASGPSASPAAPASEPAPAASASPNEPAPSGSEPASDPGSGDWTRVLEVDDGSTQFIGDQIVWGSAGFYAIGSRWESGEGGPRPVEYLAWRSPDGRAWEEIPFVSGDFVAPLLTTSASGEFILYANRPVGTQGETELVALRSSNASTWAEFESGLPDGIAVQAVERGPAGFLLVAGQTAFTNPTIWLSSDGIGWEQVYEFDQSANFVQIDDADGGAEGYVVLGRRIALDGATYRRFAFASADGREWFGSEEPFGPDDQDFVFATSVTSLGPDWIATLGHPTGEPTAVWHSEDGLAWAERGTIDAEPNTAAGVLETTGIGLYFAPSGAADFDGLRGLWSSTDDGGSWDRADLGDDPWINDLAESPGIVAVIGAVHGAEFDGSAGIWIRSTE